MLSFAPQPLVGNGFIRSVVMVLPASTGRDTAIYVFVQCKCASKKAPLKKCSAYGADIITPHLPQAASSPQAPQGEDNGVHRKTQHRTNVARNVTVSTIVSNRATRDNRIRSCVNSLLKSLGIDVRGYIADGGGIHGVFLYHLLDLADGGEHGRVVSVAVLGADLLERKIG